MWSPYRKADQLKYFIIKLYTMVCTEYFGCNAFLCILMSGFINFVLISKNVFMFN